MLGNEEAASKIYAEVGKAYKELGDLVQANENFMRQAVLLEWEFLLNDTFAIAAHRGTASGRVGDEPASDDQRQCHFCCLVAVGSPDRRRMVNVKAPLPAEAKCGITLAWRVDNEQIQAGQGGAARYGRVAYRGLRRQCRRPLNSETKEARG